MHRYRHLVPYPLVLACALSAGCDAPPPSNAARAPSSAPSTDVRPAPAHVSATPEASTIAQLDDPGRYTSLEETACEVTETDEETCGSTSRCPGPGGYALDVQDYDARMSIDVVAPDGAKTPLHLWSLGSGGFSSLGPRAEWRFADGDGERPTALVVRHNAYEFPETPTRQTSYLIVAKLSAGDVCVIGKIPPGARQNERARALADRAAAAACLPREAD